jgi:tetratricopeptide (TPR) repeat protein
MRTILLAATLLTLARVPGLAAQGAAEPEHTAEVPLYANLGRHAYPISTQAQLAQQYFDQGLRLFYGFNHAEAVRAFLEAERIDSSCAMCAWGAALALGPNINAGMDDAAGRLAHATVRRALAGADRVAPRERALIQALAERYSADPAAPRATLDSLYADAMAGVAARFPNDVEILVLHADAMMNLSPWNYWTARGEPRPATPIILERLERVLAENPDHPGACHLFIHAVEAQDPARAVPCAERLAALMPGAGHIVHMPGHIYIRVGRYLEAMEANRHALHADESYLEGPAASRRGIYAQGYYPHNHHFLGFAAAMAGASATAIEAARQTAKTVGPELARSTPWLENVTPVVFTTLVTFGRWDEVLAEPLPPADLRYATGMAYYARGAAFAAKRRWAEAQASLDTVRAIARVFPEGDNRTALRIAVEALSGEIALRRGRLPAAIAAFGAAVTLEDGLAYTEPPTWYYPMRHSLGKALLAAKRPQEAQRVYEQDLVRFPENGWALRGLVSSLEAQRHFGAARIARERLERAWMGADVVLTGSRF